MELKTYLRILIKKWWIVLPTFAITLIAVYQFTLNQIPVYEAKATFVVKLSTAFQDDKSYVSAVNTLSSRTEIANTFAQVANSKLIKQQATDALNLSREQKGDLPVESRVLPGTNIIEVSVQGSDPALIWRFANAVGSKTVAYVQALGVYDLVPLDQASRSDSPILPKTTLNLMLGGILGLVLGVGLAFFLEYWQTPEENVINDAERVRSEKAYYAVVPKAHELVSTIPSGEKR